MGKGNVEHKLGADGKIRLKGAVGSHATLVRGAKAPTTEINKVNIGKVERPVQKINSSELAKAIAEKQAAHDEWGRTSKIWVASEKANPELVKAEENLDEIESYSYDYEKQDYSDEYKEADAIVENIKKTDPIISKARNENLAAMDVFYKKSRIVREIEEAEAAWNEVDELMDKRDDIENETPAIALAKEKIAKYRKAINSRLARFRTIDQFGYDTAVNLIMKNRKEDPELVAMSEKIDYALQKADYYQLQVEKSKKLAG